LVKNTETHKKTSKKETKQTVEMKFLLKLKPSNNKSFCLTRRSINHRLRSL